MTSVGQTTNENSKWGDIHDWHKRQTKKYKQALKEGKLKKQESSTGDDVGCDQKPNVCDDDGDVTCTPGGPREARPSQPVTQDRSKLHFYDPGPFPKNLYDRGFVENWKEVIFPMSLRKGCISLGGYTKRIGPPPSQSKARTDSISSKNTDSGGKTKEA
jgi:hypothetical protein